MDQFDKIKELLDDLEENRYQPLLCGLVNEGFYKSHYLGGFVTCYPNTEICTDFENGEKTDCLYLEVDPFEYIDFMLSEISEPSKYPQDQEEKKSQKADIQKKLEECLEKVKSINA